MATIACPVEKPGSDEQVIARDPIRTGDLAECRDCAERHHIVCHRAGPKIFDVADRHPKWVVGLCCYPIGAAEQIEVVDERRAHVGRQRIEEPRDRHAEHFRLGAVDISIDLRG